MRRSFLSTLERRFIRADEIDRGFESTVLVEPPSLAEATEINLECPMVVERFPTESFLQDRVSSSASRGPIVVGQSDSEVTVGGWDSDNNLEVSIHDFRHYIRPETIIRGRFQQRRSTICDSSPGSFRAQSKSQRQEFDSKNNNMAQKQDVTSSPADMGQCQHSYQHSYNLADNEISMRRDILESVETATENSLSDRIIARGDHLVKVKNSAEATHALLYELLEESFAQEFTMQEISPVWGSQLAARTLKRIQSVVASKENLENIPRNVAMRISDALDNEEQMMIRLSEAVRNAEEQQKQLRDLDERAYLEDLALLEKHQNERIKHFNAIKEEKAQLLDSWAMSRTDLMEVVNSTEQNTHNLQELLDILVDTVKETVKQHEAKLEAEVRRVRIEANEASVANKSECSICLTYIENPYENKLGFSITHGLKKRSCLIPCNHAMICLDCATKVWDTTKRCPFCTTTLNSKPLAIYL